MGAHIRLAPDPAGEDLEPHEPAPIRVTLVDAHETMRRALRLLLEAEEGIEVVAEAAGLEAVEIDREGSDVLVADFRVSDGSRPRAIGRILERAPGLGVVLLTMHDVPAFARQVLDAGALGIVRKQFADGELAQAVRAAARGEVYPAAPTAAHLRRDR